MSDIPEDMPEEYYASFTASHLTVVDESFSRRKKAPTPPDVPDAPTIQVVGGLLDKIATLGENALIASGIRRGFSCSSRKKAEHLLKRSSVVQSKTVFAILDLVAYE